MKDLMEKVLHSQKKCNSIWNGIKRISLYLQCDTHTLLPQKWYSMKITPAITTCEFFIPVSRSV